MNTIKIIVFAIIALLPAFGANAQGWERIYPDVNPGENAAIKKIIPAPGDGYLLLVGDQLSALGQAADFHIVKIAENGATEWVRHYDFGLSENAVDFIATSDGGYAVIYYTLEGSPGAVILHLAKLDDQFNIEFNKTFSQQAPAWNETGRRIVENAAGYWIVGSAYPSDGPSVGFITGCSTSGSDLGYMEWGTPNMNVLDAVQDQDGNIIVIADRLGNSPIQPGTIGVAKINAAGNSISWEKNISDANAILKCRSIVAAPDGGFLLSAARVATSMVIKLDEQGNTLWQQLYPGQPGEATPGGAGLLSATTAGDGYWMTNNDNSNFRRIILHRLDLNGNILFQKVFGAGFSNTTMEDILATSDDGCLFGGAREIVPNSQQRTPYAVRISSAGISYTSGISGQLSYDFDDDCLGDTDTLIAGLSVIAWQNGMPVNAATTDSSGNYTMGLDPGSYQIAVIKPNNAWEFCPDTLSATVMAPDTLTGIDFAASYIPQQVDSIYGYVFEDIDGDCFRDSFETGYAGWTILATFFNQGAGQSFSTVTDSNGYFVLPQSVLNGIENTVNGIFSIAGPAGDGLNCVPTCLDAFNISFGNSNSYEANFGVHCDSLPPCPIIDVDVATLGLRPCFNTSYHVNYCNIGAVGAADASVDVTVDPALEVIGSSIPWSAANNNTYTFDLGAIASEQCGEIVIFVHVPCDDPVGTTYCVEAHAFPDTACGPGGGIWDGSQIDVTATCSDSTVTFIITNTGTGDMSGPLDYIVIEDNVLLMQGGSFQLNASQSQEVTFPANGSFYRLEAAQAPGFPGLGMPVAWVEGCGSNDISLGFVNQYPLGDEDPWIDVFCLESTNSYDPNDKQGFPRGYSDEHYLKQNTDIEYMIRFQNTGTAPAINVEIRDTIPVQWLDPTSLRPGASSHPYDWDIEGSGVMVFRFPNINLPDSNANWDASQGFVKFRVAQRKDNPIGTVIENKAHIFFDFNAPVVTNTTFHTIGEDFIIVDTYSPPKPGVRVNIAPNPATYSITVKLEGLPGNTGSQSLTLFTPLGNAVLNESFNGNTGSIQVGHLQPGVYFYELRSDGQVVAAGKLVRL